MRAPNPLVDRRTLEKLERLSLQWQRSLTGLFGGHKPSRFAGPGQEFLDHRRFHHGDDLRRVNWLAYLRLERLFLKMFRIEPRVPVRIFVDTSESMACGGDGTGEAKFAYACRLAAMMCYVGLVRLDSIVIQPFGGGLPESYRAGGGRHRFAPALNFLLRLETGGPSDFRALARAFLSNRPARGLAVIISDFLDSTGQGCETSLEHLADYGHELLLAHVASPEDRRPPWRGEVELVDAETGQARRLELDQGAAEEHGAAFDQFCLGLRRLARRSRGRYVPLWTETPAEQAVFGPLLGSNGAGARP